MPPPRDLSMGEILIYGATGFSGRLLVQEALRRGRRPIIAGRSRKKIAQLAGAFDLPHRVFALDEPRTLEGGLAGVSVVLNAAGPFSATSGVLTAACIRHAVHYLDITGEAPVIEAAARRGAEARAAGVMLMPAVGFDVVPSDCLAAHVWGRAGAVTSLHIGISGLELMTRGAALSIIETLDKPVLARRNGRLTPVDPAKR
jgi:short subunit dehydrogenase-like uncharacterized protein